MKKIGMDTLTLLLGLVLIACGLIGWVTFFYLNRRRKQRQSVQPGEGLKTAKSAEESKECKADQASST